MDDEVNTRIFENYKSPFLMPPVLECSSPRDHNMYPALHSEAGLEGNFWSHKTPCPVHNCKERGRREVSYDWKRWVEMREKYATAEPGIFGEGQRAEAMYAMLGYVSASNPPDAPSVVVRQSNLPLYRNPCYWLGALAVLLTVLLLVII